MRVTGVAMSVGLLALVGCEADPVRLEWRIRFATEDLRARAVAVEALVLRGRCGDPDAVVVYADRFAPDGVGVEPRLLGRGEYSIEAYGRDGECRRFAGDCEDQTFPPPEGTVVELVLQARPEESVCAPGDTCMDGECASERVDAGPPDAGMRPRDGGPGPGLDGSWCVTNADDTTGQLCGVGGGSCEGLVCHEVFFGFANVCTRACSTDGDCVAGWSCDAVAPTECPGGCPPRVCTCGDAFDAFGSESACDGLDDDCDGRIDESGVPSGGAGGGSAGPCEGEGEVCVCRDCVCPPDLTPCPGGGCFDLPTSESNCGACGRECGVGFTCTGGECDCDGMICGDECVQLASSERHCGGCDRACGADQVCREGSCVCAGTMCGTTCTDTSTDENHCGTCGNTCGPGQTCCGGSCRGLASDEMNCGRCGNACSTTGSSTCCGGECVNTATDEANCGACGTSCSTVCVSGSCE